MHDTLTVAKFTAKDLIKRKSFIISTIIILAMIVIGFNVPNIIKNFKNGNDKIIIVDKDKVFEDKFKLLNEKDEIITDELSVEEIKKQIEDRKVEYGIIVEKENNNITLTYILENKMSSGPNEEFINKLTELYKDLQIEKLNISNSELEKLYPTFDFKIDVVDDLSIGNPFVVMMLSMLLFYAVYFYAIQVSTSVTTEKTSKIIETLVTSTSPTNIILGKTIGVGIVGICQLILIVITMVLSANIFLDHKILEMALDTSSITVSLGLFTLLYFVLGYLAYSLLYALTGSTVSKPEEIQSANQPITILTVIGFYLAYFTMTNPSSGLNKLAALLPISSPFCMPFRIMMDAATPNEIMLSIGILLVTIILVANIAIKIYRNAIINYGKSSLKDIIKMYKQK